MLIHSVCVCVCAFACPHLCVFRCRHLSACCLACDKLKSGSLAMQSGEDEEQSLLQFPSVPQ